MEQTSRWARLAGVVRLPLTARPAPKDLSGGSAPYFGCDGALHAVVHSGRSSRATSSRDTLAKRAKNNDSTAVLPAVGAPGEWDILHILLLQDTKVGTVVVHFTLEHGGRAVRSSANGVWRGDTYIQSGDCVPQRLGQDISGAESLPRTLRSGHTAENEEATP